MKKLKREKEMRFISTTFGSNVEKVGTKVKGWYRGHYYYADEEILEDTTVIMVPGSQLNLAIEKAKEAGFKGICSVLFMGQEFNSIGYYTRFDPKHTYGVNLDWYKNEMIIIR